MNGLLDSQLYSWAEKVISGYGWHGCQSTHVGIMDKQQERRQKGTLCISYNSHEYKYQHVSSKHSQM